MTVRFYLNDNLGTAKGVSISPFMWDVPATRLFANSLASSVIKQFSSIKIVAVKRHANILSLKKSKPIPYPEFSSPKVCGLSSNIVAVLEKKENLPSFDWGDGRTCIRADICHTQKNGRKEYCKISIEESNTNPCGVRIANIIPDFARVVYAVAYLLKALPTPKGYGCLHSIDLIKDFTHYNDAKEKITLMRDKDGNPKEVVLVPRESY